MAVRYSISAPILVQKPDNSSRRAVISTRLSVRATNSHAAGGSSTSLQIIATPPRIKVFEDRSEGIICYRDADGEITCEGYDEGPRFHHQVSRFTASNSRDTEIVDLLQNWLQIVDGNGYYYNGSNRFC